MFGLDAGQTFSYPVIATHRDGKPLGYSLIDPPPGATVNAQTGQLRWITTEDSTDASFNVQASDGLGSSEQQSVSLTVCHSPLHWNADRFSCL